jgi:hypothetical protein
VTKRARARSAPIQPGAADAGLSRNAFPSLLNFLKGYLHEDYPDVHGSLPAAVEAFVADADPAERQQLARELESLTVRLSGRSPRALRRFVTGDLGSRWEPKSREELIELLDLVRGRI